MPWYRGNTLLDALESAPVLREISEATLRFPIQSVLRPASGGRLYAGRVLSGSVYPGQEVVVYPSGRRTRVVEPEAAQGASIALRLADELDLSRGHMIASAAQPPASGGALRATLLWLSEQCSEPTRRYLLKHTTQYAYAEVKPINGPLAMNDISQVEIICFRPLFFDPYRENRHTGSFILISPATSQTVAAGLIEEPMASAPVHLDGLTVWFTGLSGAGKSTIASEVSRKLREAGIRSEWLDGDEVRKELTHDLGFSREDRSENAARIAYVANLLTRQAVVVLVSIVSPFRKPRQAARARIGSYIEVFVNAPLDVCEQRDPKGLYRKARAGELKGFTGIDDPYEPPLAPEVECRTDQESVAESVAKVVEALRTLGYVIP
jgi:bifunctional enzyme CysN/CysC